MSTTIIQRTISAATQEAISFSNSAIARSIPIPSGWNSIRLGMRLHFTQGTFVTPVRFAFGLCHGTTNLINSNSTDHFAGIWSDSGFTSNGVIAGSVYFNVNLKPMTRVGTVITTGANITADSRYGNTANLSTADRGILFLDVTKGSPNYTMNAWFNVNGTAPDYPESAFAVMMNEAAAPGGNSLYPDPSNGTGQTIAVDEGANGVLNALSVWWNQSSVTLEVCDFGFSVLS